MIYNYQCIIDVSVSLCKINTYNIKILTYILPFILSASEEHPYKYSDKAEDIAIQIQIRLAKLPPPSSQVRVGLRKKIYLPIILHDFD